MPIKASMCCKEAGQNNRLIKMLWLNLKRAEQNKRPLKAHELKIEQIKLPFLQCLGKLLMIVSYFIWFLPAFVSSAASHWKMSKPFCLRSTTESPTCAFSKTNCRLDALWFFFLYTSISLDFRQLYICMIMTPVSWVSAGSRGKEWFIVPQLCTALQDAYVWRTEECKSESNSNSTLSL